MGRACYLSSVSSLGLIGNASGRKFHNEVELDPRCFRRSRGVQEKSALALAWSRYAGTRTIACENLEATHLTSGNEDSARLLRVSWNRPQMAERGAAISKTLHRTLLHKLGISKSREMKGAVAPQTRTGPNAKNFFMLSIKRLCRFFEARARFYSEERFAERQAIG